MAPLQPGPCWSFYSDFSSVSLQSPFLLAPPHVYTTEILNSAFSIWGPWFMFFPLSVIIWYPWSILSTWLICSCLFNINSNCTPSTSSRSSPLAPQIRGNTTSYVCPQNQELPISDPYNSRIYLLITLAVFPLLYKLQWGRELICLVHSCIFSIKCTTGMRQCSINIC